jgi:hypothetical protein
MLARNPSTFTILWVVVGVAVAVTHDYFDSLSTVAQVLTAAAAVALWPLVLLGFDILITR